MSAQVQRVDTKKQIIHLGFGKLTTGIGIDSRILFLFLFKQDDLQTITPSKMSNDFRGFGVSFSTNPHVDVDSNGLEDLAIGKITFFLLPTIY